MKPTIFFIIVYFIIQNAFSQVIDSQSNIKDPTFWVVEEPPVYPGGEKAMFKFLQDSIKYPKFAKENGIQGIVFVEFIVNEDGSISDVRPKKGRQLVGGGCDEEAVRVVKLMPRWLPGKQSGKTVRVRMILPVKFKLT